MKRIVSFFGAMLIAFSMWADPIELTIDRIQIQQINKDCIAYFLFYDDSAKVYVYPIYINEEDGDVEWGVPIHTPR